MSAPNSPESRQRIERKDGEVWTWSEDGVLLLRTSERIFDEMVKVLADRIAEHLAKKLLGGE